MGDFIDAIKSCCDEYGWDFCDDYSGRGMFGRTCVGVICGNPLTALSRLFGYLIDEFPDLSGEEVYEMLGEPRQDNMGLNTILYFPHIMPGY